MINFEEVTKILVALFGLAGGAAGVKMVDKFSEWRSKKEKNSILWNLSNLAEIHQLMEEMVERTPATRVLIIRGSNGGGIPKPGSEFYISVVHEHHKDTQSADQKDLHTRYRGIKVDGPYIEMLVEMLTKGFVKYKIARMPAGILKNIYQSDGIKYSEIHHVKNSSTEMFYLSISTTVEDEVFSDNNVRVELDLAVDKIKQVFSKY